MVTTLAMAFAGFIMILFASLMEGLLQASEKIQIHAHEYRNDPDLYKRIENPETLLKALEKEGFYAAPRLYGFGLMASGSTSAGVQLRAIDPERETKVTQVNNHVLTGNWLDKNKPVGVVLGRKLAKTLAVKPGDEIVFVGQASDGSMANDLYYVQGILKSVGEEIDRAAVYMLNREFERLMVIDKGVHEIAVMRPDRGTDLDKATRDVKRIASEYETMNWKDLKPVIARILDLADAQMIIMVSITYIAVAMIVLNAMLMSVFERIRELGIMKAIGVTPWQIIIMVYVETLVQLVMASVTAFILGTAASLYFQNNGIDLSALAGGASFGGVAMDPIWKARITANALLIPIEFLFIIALPAVLYPAVKAALIRPVAAIHHR